MLYHEIGNFLLRVLLLLYKEKTPFGIPDGVFHFKYHANFRVGLEMFGGAPGDRKTGSPAGLSACIFLPGAKRIPLQSLARRDGFSLMRHSQKPQRYRVSPGEIDIVADDEICALDFFRRAAHFEFQFCGNSGNIPGNDKVPLGFVS